VNRLEHLFTGSVFLNITLGLWLIVENYDHNFWSLFASLIISLMFFFLGVILPDIDHEKVQRGPLKILKHFTKHRGHVHSLVAMVVYGFLVFLLTFFLLKYWYYPVIFGMEGFFIHLWADDVNRWKLESKPTRAVKIW
jgi:membrane-bound metal-dependent hydrolase YbcI (DUF457 family)